MLFARSLHKRNRTCAHANEMHRYAFTRSFGSRLLNYFSTVQRARILQHREKQACATLPWPVRFHVARRRFKRLSLVCLKAEIVTFPKNNYSEEVLDRHDTGRLASPSSRKLQTTSSPSFVGHAQVEKIKGLDLQAPVLTMFPTCLETQRSVRMKDPRRLGNGRYPMFAKV